MERAKWLATTNPFLQPDTLVMPFSNLHTLQLHMRNVHPYHRVEFPFFLSGEYCPRVRELTIHWLGIDYHDQGVYHGRTLDWGALASLPSLEVLRLHLDEYSNSQVLVNRLYGCHRWPPTLKSLYVTFHYPAVEDPHDLPNLLRDIVFYDLAAQLVQVAFHVRTTSQQHFVQDALDDKTRFPILAQATVDVH